MEFPGRYTRKVFESGGTASPCVSFAGGRRPPAFKTYNSDMFGFFRNRRRRKLLAEPFSPYWESILRRNVGHYPRLAAEQQAALRDHTRIFIAEKSFVGCGGQHITDEVKVTIAGQSAMLLLGLDRDCYYWVPTIIVYPDEFQSPQEEDDWEDDHLSERVAEGLADHRGPIVLSWAAVREECPNPSCGRNVVLHEFAHELDFMDSVSDGVPPLNDPIIESAWRSVMRAAYVKHRARFAKGRRMFFSMQAAENETEFFADATEAFYCRPHDMHRESPEVFELLKAYYRVDPRAWFQE